MALEKWQQEVEITKLPKMLQEKYIKTLKSGEKREVAKYRLSYITENSAIVNDLSNKAFQEYAHDKAIEKAKRKQEAKEPLRNKLKELREERNELKIRLKSAEKGQMRVLRRIESKKSKVAKLQEEIKNLQDETLLQKENSQKPKTKPKVSKEQKVAFDE